MASDGLPRPALPIKVHTCVAATWCSRRSDASISALVPPGFGWWYRHRVVGSAAHGTRGWAPLDQRPRCLCWVVNTASQLLGQISQQVEAVGDLNGRGAPSPAPLA